MTQSLGNEVPRSPTNAGSSSPNGFAEISDLLSRLQLNSSQLQELFDGLTDIVTKSAQPTPDNDTYDLISANDVPQDVSTERSDDEDADAATPSTVAAQPVVAPSPVASNGEPVAVSVVATAPPAVAVSVVTTAPPAVAPAGTTVIASSPVIVAPVAPVSMAAPAVASTTRMFNGVSYQYPTDGTSGPFYLVTRSRDIGVFVGWENTSPLITRVSASVSFHVPSAEEGRVRMESSIAAGFARRV